MIHLAWKDSKWSTNYTVVLRVIKFLLRIIQWWYYFHFREFAKTIKRPFTVRYNPYTQSVDVLKDTPSINSVVEELRHELDIVGDALIRLNKQLGVWVRVNHLTSVLTAPPPPRCTDTGCELYLSVQWMCALTLANCYVVPTAWCMANTIYCHWYQYFTQTQRAALL